MSKDFTGPAGDPAEGSSDKIEKDLNYRKGGGKKDRHGTDSSNTGKDKESSTPSDVPEVKSETGA